MAVSLVDLVTPPPPEPEPPTPTLSPPQAQASPPRAALARPAERPAMAPTFLAGDAGREVGIDGAMVAGAMTAGSGEGHESGCNMLLRLQTALRRDRRVLVAVTDAGREGALMVWRGAWVRHPGQEGDGLAAVREAILWEVGFAPPACRREPMRGMVVVTLSDAPGAVRLALGDADWRWQDLLFATARTP